jgi:hypothetical protein
LKTHGINIDEEEHTRTAGNEFSQGSDDFDERELMMSAPRARNSEKGALFADKENSHYVEK